MPTEDPTKVLGKLASDVSNNNIVYPGFVDTPMAIIQELKDRNARNESTEMYIAAVHLGLGEDDQAFELLEKDFRKLPEPGLDQMLQCV